MSTNYLLTRSLFLAGGLAAAALMAPAAASAQIGEGWMQYDPPSSIQLDGSNGIESNPGTSTNLRNEGASYTNEGGIETFALHDPISNRCERRMQNTYLTGKRQFEGEVRISPPTDDESVMQVFGGNSGATTQMIRAYNAGGGTLRKVPGSVLLAEGIHGVWVKINVIHDIPANNVKTYVNGKLLAMGDGEATNAGTDGWYHKYGCYGTLRTGSAKVEWRNVKHFRDGNSPPGSVVDAGAAPDAGAEAGRDATAVDANGGSGGAGGAGGAGSGGAPGTGGTAGSGGGGGSGGSVNAGTGGGSGTSGSGGGPRGTGGRGGSAGSPAPTVTPPGDAGQGCGCRTAGAPSAGPWAPLLALAVALGFRRCRRMRPGRQR